MTAARYLFDVGLYGISRIRHRATNIAVNTLSIFISSVDAEKTSQKYLNSINSFFVGGRGGGENDLLTHIARV